MDELSLIIQSLVDSEVDDMILDIVYEIHSSIKGFPQEHFQVNKTNSIEKQTCICPNCGQANLIATKFAYHLAKCLGAGRQSSRQAQRRIVDQIMVITAANENHSNGHHFCKDIERIQFQKMEVLVQLDSTSSSMTLISSSKTHSRLSNDDEEYVDDFDNDDEEDWKPKKKKRRITTKTNQSKKKKNLVVVVSPKHSPIAFPNCLIPINKLRPVTKHVVIPLVPLPISSVIPSNGDKIFFKNQPISSHASESSQYLVHSPLNLVDDEESSIIIFQEDRIH